MKTKTKEKTKEKLIKELKENIIHESIQEDPDKVFLDEMIECLKALKK